MSICKGIRMIKFKNSILLISLYNSTSTAGKHVEHLKVKQKVAGWTIYVTYKLFHPQLEVHSEL